MRTIKINITMAVFKGITSFEIKDGYTSIGESAFILCSSLTSIVIPNSVESIGDSAFMYCSSLESVVIPEGVASIGKGAFAECTSLTSVVIPNSVRSIGWSSFSGCSSLTSIVIPDSVMFIGCFAFSRCNSLAEISFLNSDFKYDKTFREAVQHMSGLRRVFVYPSRVDEFQAFFNSPLFLFHINSQRVEVLPLPTSVMGQIQRREFIHTSSNNTKRYTLNQRHWIATFILAAYAASRMGQQKLPHLPPELVRMILEMVRRADADNEGTVNTTKLIEML